MRPLILGLRASPEGGADPGREDLGAVGLYDIVVGPELEARHDVGVLAPGRRHDDGDALPPRAGLHPPQELEAIHARKHDVEDDAVGMGVLEGREPPLPVLRQGERPALLGEGEGEQLPDIRIVLHDEDRCLGHFDAPIR
jgi:hypothetical protein